MSTPQKSPLQNFIQHHSRFCESNGNPKSKYYPCTCKRDEAAKELARLRKIEAAASDVAKNWFTDRRNTGWAMDNLVNALEGKPSQEVQP